MGPATAPHLCGDHGPGRASSARLPAQAQGYFSALASHILASQLLWSDGSPGPRCVTPSRLSCRALGSRQPRSLEN